MLKFLVRGLLILACVIAAVGFFYRDRVSQLLAVNSLFSEEKITENFSTMTDLFYSTELPRGDGPVSPLPEGTQITLPAGFDSWAEARSLTALVVLKDGEIVHESYYQGTGPEDRRISWSVAKSYLATLVGTAVDAGEIPDLDALVTDYVPAFAGTAYEGVSIRNVLNMSSGVVFNEDYFDFWSDINKMGRVLALGGSMDAFAADLDETFIEPGTRFQYTSIDTHVLGMVLRAATGESLPELITTRLIEPLGLESDGAYITDGDGVAFALGGLNFTTRDYARFGQMILQEGEWQGKQIVSADWVLRSTRATAKTAEGALKYGYQWWMPRDIDPAQRDHEFFGIGVYGQHLYINPEKGVVIAHNGSDRAFRDTGVIDTNIAMFRALAEAAAGGQ
ncbi:MAG: serine hydrolase [Pseudomonadota bacterium]